MLTRPAAETVEATIAEATIGTYQTTVTATGTIEPSKQADLDFSVTGRVTNVSVEPGDTVKVGDTLAQLDTAALDAELASARAQLEAAETTADEDGEESSVQRASHDAAVASAEATVVGAAQSLDAATLTATFRGTVAAVTVEVGDQAGSGATSTNAGSGGATATTVSTAAVTVITPKTFVVTADVAADDIDQVSEGLQVTITPSGAAEDVYGTVAEVGRVAEADDSGAATFPVTVTVTGTQDGLYAGTSADLSIIVKQIPDVLTVPTSAVSSEDGTTYVDKIDGSTTERTTVEVGQTFGAATEITAGLVEGDQMEVAAVVGRTGVDGGTENQAPGIDRQGRGAGGGQGDLGGNP
ncbi:efflux RND transporter periplasmic adaptor subunit [Nocardioides salsibiostraticola]